MKKVLFAVLGVIIGGLAASLIMMIVSTVLGFIGGIVDYNATMNIINAFESSIVVEICLRLAIIGSAIAGAVFMISKAD